MRRLTLNRAVLLILVIVAVATSLLSALDNIGEFGLNDPEWRSGWLQNFSTEMFGAALTLVLIGRIIGEEDRKRERDENALQLDVLRDAVTKAVTEEMRRIQKANAIARLQAAKDEPIEVRQLILDEMRSLDLLQGASLRQANLQGAGLRKANLQGADLGDANLQEAGLRDANLHGADLSWTNLQGTDLSWANLQGVGLSRANLRGAYLEGANLYGADLQKADLQEADLADATFDEKTVLPDDEPFGERSYWTPETDMARFTDSDHPNFWRSNEKGSPAYRGDAGTD
jgi:hypothetical protein